MNKRTGSEFETVWSSKQGKHNKGLEWCQDYLKGQPHYAPVESVRQLINCWPWGPLTPTCQTYLQGLHNVLNLQVINSIYTFISLSRSCYRVSFWCHKSLPLRPDKTPLILQHNTCILERLYILWILNRESLGNGVMVFPYTRYS